MRKQLLFLIKYSKNSQNLLIKEGALIINEHLYKDKMNQKIKEQYQEDKVIKNELSSFIKGEKKEEKLVLILNCKIIEKDLNAILNFFSYLMNNEKINENLKRNGKNGREKRRHDFSMKKDNSEIKGIVEDLKKEEGLYD